MSEALFYGYGVLLLFEPLEQSASIESVRNGRAMFRYRFATGWQTKRAICFWIALFVV